MNTLVDQFLTFSHKNVPGHVMITGFYNGREKSPCTPFWNPANKSITAFLALTPIHLLFQKKSLPTHDPGNMLTSRINFK